MKTYYIIIEKECVSFPTIVTDNNGNPLTFFKLKDAKKEAKKCQDAQIVEIT